MAPANSRHSRYDSDLHGPLRVVGTGFQAQVWDVLCCVPAGSVTTYGDIATSLGLASVARQVGWALAALPADRGDVPWHRVVNAKGELSRRGDGSPSKRQAKLLQSEGVPLNAKGRVADFASRRHRFQTR
jgi:methylated-DNA-protein-cysteine methyltransferase-like protein